MQTPATIAPRLPQGLTLLFATACGTMVANLYYPQTLIEQIGPDIGLSRGAAGLVTTLTQLGYGVGLALIVPLGDLFENRMLVLVAITGAVLGALGIATSHGPAEFLIASVLTGVCSTGAQILLPLATHLTSPQRRGVVIGQIMSGLLIGIMLARPVASLLTAAWGWRAVFLFSAAMMSLFGLALVQSCPKRKPETQLGYGALIASVIGQFHQFRALRLRALYQALLFTAFNLFWTAAPLALIRHFGFTQGKIALFALAGAGGALVAPLAGALADRGKSWPVTLLSLAGAGAMFLFADGMVAIGSIIGFALAAILLDAATQANQITGQRIIFSLSAEARSRVNSAYMTAMFIVGASGSLIGSLTFASGGWTLSAWVGAGLCLCALAIFLLFDRGASKSDAHQAQ